MFKNSMTAAILPECNVMYMFFVLKILILKYIKTNQIAFYKLDFA